MTTRDMVAEFHRVFGQPIRTEPCAGTQEERDLRVDLVSEEFCELADALAYGCYPEEGNPPDVVETADALADIVYVCYGAALTFGIDLDAVIAEVHRANMSKLGADGKPIYRPDGKVLKGPGYTPPDVARVLGVRR